MRFPRPVVLVVCLVALEVAAGPARIFVPSRDSGDAAQIAAALRAASSKDANKRLAAYGALHRNGRVIRWPAEGATPVGVPSRRCPVQWEVVVRASSASGNRGGSSTTLAGFRRKGTRGLSAEVVVEAGCWSSDYACGVHFSTGYFSFYDPMVDHAAILAAVPPDAGTVEEFYSRKMVTEVPAVVRSLHPLTVCGKNPSVCVREQFPQLRGAVRPGDDSALLKYLVANHEVCRLTLAEGDHFCAANEAAAGGGLCELVFVDGCAGRFGLVCAGAPREIEGPCGDRAEAPDAGSPGDFEVPAQP